MKAKYERCYSYYANTYAGFCVPIEREDFRHLLSASRHIKKEDYEKIVIYDREWRMLGFISWLRIYK